MFLAKSDSLAARDDAKRVTWQKISSRIAVAVKRAIPSCSAESSVGGADPRSNPRLEQELNHAKAGCSDYLPSDM